MSMYFVGIDISKYKHDCCILSAVDQNVVTKFAIKNDNSGFQQLIKTLHSLSNSEDIKIGFESTAHYALNLKLFLENAHHSFMEINPLLIKEYKKSTSLRRTKTDSVDCESIARWLMTVEYKPHSKGFYHAYSLKSLTRLRDRLVRQRSFYLYYKLRTRNVKRLCSLCVWNGKRNGLENQCFQARFWRGRRDSNSRSLFRRLLP